MTHLWEVDHPYYAEDGDYNVRGRYSRYESWAQFAEETFCNGDRDLNLMYRWDWHKAGYHDYDGRETLSLYFVLQRKAICCSVDIAVTEADEPAIRAWLTECAWTMRNLWAPLSLATAPDGPTDPN